MVEVISTSPGRDERSVLTAAAASTSIRPALRAMAWRLPVCCPALPASVPPAQSCELLGLPAERSPCERALRDGAV
jgi:hypothetical protein